MSSSSSSSSLFVPREYYCYQCDRIVSIVSSSELICPICHGGFLEDFDTAPNPNPHHNNSDNFPMIFSSGSGGNSLGEFGLLGGLGPGGASRGPNEFNPFLFLHNYLNTLRAGGGIQLVFETSGGGGGGGGGGGSGVGGGGAGLNLGDYFIGAGLEQLIQQLAENGQTRHGAPPATKSAVEGLPDVKITEELLATDSSLCAVCKDNFEVNEEAKRMPCKHLYHKDCIFPWLELHNSCPVCRYELPTDDPDYERRRRSGGIGYNRNANNGNSSTSGGGGSGSGSGSGSGLGSGSGSGSGNQDNANNNLLMPRTVERRLRISWPPWMFRFGSSAEASNGGGGGGNNNDGGGNSGSNGNNNGGSGELNSGSRGGGGGGARQEDVD